MIILLSPAKSMDESEPNDKLFATKPELNSEAKCLVKFLKKKDSNFLCKLMKISKNLGNLNAMRYENFDKALSKQACLLFKGPAFLTLDLASCTKKQKKYLQGHLRVLSGLYGVLKPFDLISPYRLEMGTKLKIGENKNLYEFWGDKIANQINEELKNKKLKIVVNVASNEYFKSVKIEALHNKIKIINCIFKEKKGGALKVVSVFAKKARGSFARWMAENDPKAVDELKGFNKDGYSFSEEQSSENVFIYTRLQPAKKGKKRKGSSKRKDSKKKKKLVNVNERTAG